MDLHYIYQHRRKDSKDIFYIGKGVQKKSTHRMYRAYEKTKRNNIWNSIVSKTEYSVEIIFWGLSEVECLTKEIELIKHYGKIYNKTGTLANYTDGGEGQLRFYKGSEIQKEAALIARKIAWSLPRNENQLNALSKNALIANPPKSIVQHDLEMNVIGEYDSMMDAERATGVSHGCISMCCNGKRKRAGKYIWKFKKNKMKEELVSFNVAKLAKEKGFEVKTDFGSGFLEDGSIASYYSKEYHKFSAPTQSLLQKWLREEHKINVISDYDVNVKSYFCWIMIKNNTSNQPMKYYNTYEEALEKGLYEALKLINQ